MAKLSERILSYNLDGSVQRIVEVAKELQDGKK